MALDFRARARLLFPWMPNRLLDIFTSSWEDHGDAGLALLEMRQHKAYEQFFPGNRREDGTIRLSEQEYLSTIESFERTILEAGVNPSLFSDQFSSMIAGDVSANEFRDRVSLVTTQILQNIDEVRQAFAFEAGVDDLSDAALFAIVFDADVGNDILNRRISLAQVSGEAFRFGFGFQSELAGRLVSSGIRQDAASDLFSQAGERLGVLDALVHRFNERDPDFGLGEFADLFLGDVAQRQRVRRVLEREQSSFSPLGAPTRLQSGEFFGLERR